MPKRKASGAEPMRRSTRARQVSLTWDSNAETKTATSRSTPKSKAAPRSKRAKASTSPTRPAKSHSKGRKVQEEVETNVRRRGRKKKVEETNDDEPEIISNDEDEEEEEEIPSEDPLYEVGQKVLARDQDGILYQALIRRRLHGVHQHKQVQIGMVNSQEEIQALLEEEIPATWHYFVHYFQWNVNWDRWVSQEDVLPLNDENIELSKNILLEHKTLMKEFKQQSKHVDGGAFLTVWRQKLKKLLGQDKDDDKAKKRKSNKKAKRQALEKQAQMQTQSLWNRPPAQAQQLVLNFGLKKILVEEWELIAQFKMLHVLPVPKESSIHYVLKKYLKEMKGIEMTDPVEEEVSSSNSANAQTNDGVSESGTAVEEESANSGKLEPNNSVSASEAVVESTDTTDSSSKPENENASNTDATEPREEESHQDSQEWLDMVTGMCMLFDEALPFRLLYPSEQAQLQVLEKKFPTTPKSQLYGCEFLLRLCCQLPALLADTYQKEEDTASAAEDTIKPILAKVYDFLRYLQTNQSTEFDQAYRKPNTDEIRQQAKLDRKKLREMEKMNASG